MKILIAINVRRQREAGAAAVALNHARELERLGHSVECWFREDVLKRPPKPKRLQELFFAVAVAKQILSSKNKFDVVNIHAPSGCAYGIWRRFFARAACPPYVMTMQGSEERYSRAMRIEHRKGRAWHFGWKNRLWHRIYHQTMYDYSIKCADYGVVANREGWLLAELKYGLEPGRIWFVPNGADEHFFTTRAYAPGISLNLLFVGTWLDRKGVYYLADAFLLLSKKLPGVRLTVAGCLAEEAQVRAYFSPEIREQVSVSPFVRREEMLALYSAHDIFVFPSLVEGMPLTLLEAMATAMPVVTTNTSGMADVVEDGVNGLLVVPADPTGLALAIERLCRSPELRQALGTAAQNTMRRYTWEKVTVRVEEVLRLAAASKRV